ncbi:P-loop ATPase, Sll1717 family [Actinoplanes subtropicus]|uniref:P-loop ATPase, Sll1717 family n=1 Tax=Actinoplanes subtropicus TaxID=543632 RepID=UPI0006900225|nr:hypothetical protein [Actinoplanes subtropicus]
MTTVIDRLYFGRDEAELDATAEGLLRVGFLRTDAYEAAASGRKRLIIGRKGAGKSAICTMIHANVPASCVITPDDTSGHEARAFHLDGVTAAKAKEAVWRYVIAVQLAKYLVTHARDEHGEIPEPVDALRRFLAANGEAVDFRLHEKLWKVAKRLKSSLALEAFGAKVALEVGGPSEGIEAINRLEVVEDGVTAAIGVLKCPAAHGALVLIDQIESVWNNDSESDDVVTGLLMAAKQVPQRFPGVRCCVFLRTDIYDQLQFTERDKLRGEEMRIDWTPWALHDLLVQRIRASLAAGLPAEQLWDAVFEEGVGTDLVRRTLQRPRDVIQLANRCRDVAAQYDHIRIAPQDVSEALELFSAWKLQDLSDEYHVNYPFLPRVLSTFEDSGYLISRDRLTEQLEPVLECARDDFPAHARYLDVAAMIEILFGIGFLGTGSPWAPMYCYDRGARVKPSATAFMIHPCFRPALRATAPDSAVELEPEYLRRRALRRNLAATNVFGGIDTGVGRVHRED